MDDELEVRILTPDFDEDLGVVGKFVRADMTLRRRDASELELTVDYDSEVLDLLRVENCGILVRLRGRVEFLGHVDEERGTPEGAMFTVVEETEEFDNTLAYPIPIPIGAGYGENGWYSTGAVEPTALEDSAQAFPVNHESAGHYPWAFYGWDAFGESPSTVGQFLAPMMALNFARKGYARLPILSGGSNPLLADLGNAGAPYQIVTNPGWALGGAPPIGLPPWVSTFAGVLVRFQTLREVMLPFMDWADEFSERSFNMVVAERAGGGFYLGIDPGAERFPITLSEAGGTVIDYEWMRARHSGSRFVLGGPGDMHERLFVEHRVPARESTGHVVEVFKDSTSAGLRYRGEDSPPEAQGEFAGWPRRYFRETYPLTREKNAARGYFRQSAAKSAAESAPEYNLEVVLQENDEVRFGGPDGLRLGQQVELDLRAGVPIVGRIETVVVEYTADNGLEITPAVGDGVIDSDQLLARAVRALARQRRQESSDR